MLHRFAIALLLVLVLLLPTSVIAQDTQPVIDPPPGVTIHVVQRGETLFLIALQYGLTTDQLAQLNSITDPSNILVGQRLLVPNESSTESLLTHIVQPGESLNSIAELYHVDALALADLNGISAANPLYVGQSLTFPVGATDPVAVEPAAPVESNDGTEANPPASEPSEPTEEPEVILHTVVRGETLFQIATQYGLTVADLVQANGITDPTIIFAGQQILIPGIEPPQIALDLPESVLGLSVDPLVLTEGETGRIHLTTAAPMTVEGTFLGRPLHLISEANNTEHTALVGVPMFSEAGIYPLVLELTDSSEQPLAVNANIQVIMGGYGSEYINLLEDRTGLLDPAIDDAELNMLSTITSNFTATRYFDGPLGLPAAATMTSPFGTRRSYNGGGFNRFHQGADFAGAPGSPILAAAAGTVVMVDTLNVRGNATIIDHGWGVFTTYSHQTEQYVHVGEQVIAGQVIGSVGSTGRVTGAHLHWEVWVNGIPVDPMQWVRESFN